MAERTQQASLLDLTHDSIFVRDMDDVITYWNLGSQELFGWTPDEAIGKYAHELLQSVFPVPIEEIHAELLRSGRWDGELEKTRADGTRLVVSARWSLRRDEQGRPAAILATNNDITERKRREQKILTLIEELGKRSLNLRPVTRNWRCLRTPFHMTSVRPFVTLPGFRSSCEKVQPRFSMKKASGM